LTKTPLLVFVLAAGFFVQAYSEELLPLLGGESSAV
jgi:hypothetical protein